MEDFIRDPQVDGTLVRGRGNGDGAKGEPVWKKGIDEYL